MGRAPGSGSRAPEPEPGERGVNRIADNPSRTFDKTSQESSADPAPGGTASGSAGPSSKAA
jgi:hypothetical protein